MKVINKPVDVVFLDIVIGQWCSRETVGLDDLKGLLLPY